VNIKVHWDEPNKIKTDDKNEIQKAEDLFEEIEDSLVKLADVQSSK